MDTLEISVQETAELLKAQPDLTLIDVREDFERGICSLPASLQLTEALAEEMIEKWDRDRLIVFHCHYGGRSRSAAEYFRQQGFRKVRNMTGGIDAWASEIDPSLPRY